MTLWHTLQILHKTLKCPTDFLVYSSQQSHGLLPARSESNSKRDWFLLDVYPYHIHELNSLQQKGNDNLSSFFQAMIPGQRPLPWLLVLRSAHWINHSLKTMRELSLRKKPQTSNKLLMGGSWETSCEVIFISTYIRTVVSLLTSFQSFTIHIDKYGSNVRR